MDLQIADWLYDGPSVTLNAWPTCVCVRPRDRRRILNCFANSLISSRLTPSTTTPSCELLLIVSSLTRTKHTTPLLGCQTAPTQITIQHLYMPPLDSRKTHTFIVLFLLWTCNYYYYYYCESKYAFKKGKGDNVPWKHRQGARLPLTGLEQVGRYTIKSAMCGQCGYLPSLRASVPFDRYQVTLLGDRGTQVLSSLPKATAQWCPSRTQTTT